MKSFSPMDKKTNTPSNVTTVRTCPPLGPARLCVRDPRACPPLSLLQSSSHGISSDVKHVPLQIFRLVQDSEPSCSSRTHGRLDEPRFPRCRDPFLISHKPSFSAEFRARIPKRRTFEKIEATPDSATNWSSRNDAPILKYKNWRHCPFTLLFKLRIPYQHRR